MSQSVYSQSDPIQQAEILIRNSTSHSIFVKVFPVGAVFSGLASPATGYEKKYSLTRSDPDDEVF